MTVAGNPTDASGQPVPVDRRRRRVEATRTAIRDAALELVAEHGIDAVSIEAIAERADVGYRTFFNHFTCKEEALVESGAERARRITEAFTARPASESPLEALRAVILEGADAWIADEKVALSRRLIVIEANPSLLVRFHAEFAAMERSVALAIAARCGLDVERDLYPSLLAGVAIAAMRTCVHRWKTLGSTTAMAPLMTEAFDLLAHGLEPPRPAAAGTAPSDGGAA